MLVFIGVSARSPPTGTRLALSAAVRVDLEGGRKVSEGIARVFGKPSCLARSCKSPSVVHGGQQQVVDALQPSS